MLCSTFSVPSFNNRVRSQCMLTECCCCCCCWLLLVMQKAPLLFSCTSASWDEWDPSYWQEVCYCTPEVVGESEWNFISPSVFCPLIILETKSDRPTDPPYIYAAVPTSACHPFRPPFRMSAHVRPYIHHYTHLSFRLFFHMCVKLIRSLLLN